MCKFNYHALCTTSAVAAAAMAPRHAHDCDCCTYLGRVDLPTIPEHAECDVYVHNRGQGAEIIVRTSSYEPDYHCMGAEHLPVMPGDLWRATAALVALWLEHGQAPDWRGVTVATRNLPVGHSVNQYLEHMRNRRAA